MEPFRTAVDGKVQNELIFQPHSSLYSKMSYLAVASPDKYESFTDPLI